jgi:hypothetical protein
METERMELSARERERLQVEAAHRLRLSDRQVRRLYWGVCARQGMAGWCMRCADVPRTAYAGFGPTLAAEHLARQGLGSGARASRSLRIRPQPPGLHPPWPRHQLGLSAHGPFGTGSGTCT